MPNRPNENTRLAGLAATVLAVIVILWTGDVIMAHAERAERHGEARADWLRGMRLLAEGRAMDAVDSLRKAHAIERNNASYGLDLATALTAGQKFDDAADLTNDLLTASPNDGLTNLVAARLAVRRGKIEDAKAYYHRAIYGAWPQDALLHGIETRLELAGLLDSTGASTELLAELLPLEAEVQENSDEEKRIAALYLDAHSPARAAAAYRALLANKAAADTNDSDIYAGLGEAELALTDYSGAEEDFRTGLRHEPGNVQILNRLDLAATMAALDPTLRRLTSREKYERSVRLLRAARDSMLHCESPEKISGNTDLDEADRTLKKPPPSHVTNEAAEDVLELVERIWRDRVIDCGAAVSPEEVPVNRIISALSK